MWTTNLRGKKHWKKKRGVKIQGNVDVIKTGGVYTLPLPLPRVLSLSLSSFPSTDLPPLSLALSPGESVGVNNSYTRPAPG